MIVSSHKIGGPKGVGALISRGAALMPAALIRGGGQEKGREFHGLLPRWRSDVRVAFRARAGNSYAGGRPCLSGEARRSSAIGQRGGLRGYRVGRIAVVSGSPLDRYPSALCPLSPENMRPDC